MKITTPAIDLINGLAAVIPHASNDGTVPALNAIKLELIDDRLYLIATDRYTVAVAHMPASQREGDFQALVALRDAKQLLAIVKLAQAAWKIIPTDVTLTVREVGSDSNIEVTAGMKTHILKLQHLDSAFPVWRSNIPRLDEQGAIEGVRAFHPKLLAKFARVDPNELLLTYSTSPTKPMLVMVGEQFFGMIMPVRGLEVSGMRARMPKFLGGTLGSDAPKPAIAAVPNPKKAPAKKAAPKKVA